MCQSEVKGGRYHIYLDQPGVVWAWTESFDQILKPPSSGEPQEGPCPRWIIITRTGRPTATLLQRASGWIPTERNHSGNTGDGHGRAARLTDDSGIRSRLDGTIQQASQSRAGVNHDTTLEPLCPPEWLSRIRGQPAPLNRRAVPPARVQEPGTTVNSNPPCAAREGAPPPRAQMQFATRRRELLIRESR